MKRKNNVIFLFIFASCVIVFGCSKKKSIYPDPALPSADNAFVAQAGNFKTEKKEYAAEFGIITVPENRNNPSSKLIHLPVIRIHACSANPREPIFYLAGGPGQSNMNCTPFDTLLAEHDFVMVGYRGVDGSVKLDCPEVVEALKSTEDPLEKESLGKYAKAWEASAHRFAAQGIDWNGYTIPQTIEDIEAVRRALNYRSINLQSESYGTRVAYLYGLMYPESIHRSIMIGINPPGHFMWDPRIVDEQLNTYSKLWSNDPIMSARCSDLAAAIRKVMQTMPDKWLFFSINPGKVRVVVFGMLFHRKTAAMVFDAFVAANQGDYSGIALLSFAYDYIPSIVWGDGASKGISADMDSLRIESYSTEYPNMILGSPMNTLMWKPLLYSRLQIQLIPHELRQLRYSDVETLLLSGSMDFSNPPKVTTMELLPYLRNGKQITFSEFGHVGDIMYLRQSSTERIMISYFNTGVADTSGIEYVPMDFNVSWGLPLIAKLTFILAAVLGISLIVGLIQIMKKVLKNRKIRSNMSY